ncbi:hypothetical protein F511_45085 [Dorcoceras hygrometricum]|uniref:Uncharacterized protein n=1 Tax=Dorcoceras hygrometricum TaxID=472368 RepID=A0A2Z7A482_9LAMI|nr:hypothetical protein F511_45085 [Dorcoceras hygrometricum]
MAEELAHSSAAAGVEYSDEIDSCCSTPYVSAPSSPSRAGFYYSAPASPMHFMLSKTASHSAAAVTEPNCSFEFDFCPTLPSSGGGAASADELFCNGQIRPMKLSTHLQRPQLLAPLIESEDTLEEDQAFTRGRDLKSRAGSLRRRTRSMSPMRTPRSDEEAGHREIGTEEMIIRKHDEELDEEKGSSETVSCASRSSSAGRSSKRWVFLKEFLYRSKSEGRNNERPNNKFWSSISFSPVKDKKTAAHNKSKDQNQNPEVKKKVILKNGVSKRRVPSPSPHELHYTANRAQSEEMRKKTFLPYRQGLLGCLGFSSKSYGAMNGIARALNPVYSR